MDCANTKFPEIASDEAEETFVLSKVNLQQLKEHLNDVSLAAFAIQYEHI